MPSKRSDQETFYSITDLIGLDKLQELQDAFAQANKVASTITDVEGKPITKPSNHSPVCSLIRKTGEGLRRCMLSSKILGQEARKKQSLIYHSCKGIGFTDAVAPIIVNGRHIANWLIGQQHVGDVDEERAREYALEIGADPEKMADAFHHMAKATLEGFEEKLTFLHVMARELSQMGYLNLLQRQQTEELTRIRQELELHQKSLEQLVADRTEKLMTSNQRLEAEIAQKVAAEKELIVARQMADSANAAKSEFLANMSHEIRTPMNAVTGLTHLLMQTDLTAQQQDYLNKITLSAENLLGIINDILDFSKIEADKLKLEQICFDLTEDILHNIIQVVSQPAEAKNLEVMLDLPPTLPGSLVGDPVRLRQVLINLLSNAVKFTERGSVTLAIDVVHQDEKVVRLRFEVRDSGIGMTAGQRSRLFKAFSQADSSTTRKFGGTGLGLTISKRLVEMMGGEIGAESVYGEGSIFWFTAEFAPALGTAVKKEVASCEKCRYLNVLVVDDNDITQTILLRQLRQLHHRVTAVGSGEEAISLLQTVREEEAFDLVLLDWKMPEMDGLATARFIQAGQGLAKIPAIIMMTAHNRRDLLDAAQGVELAEVLTKPILPTTLLRAIRTTFAEDSLQEATGKSDELPAQVLGSRILLVEDNAINQQIALEILENAGTRVTIAADGQEGVRRLQEGDTDGAPFDVVLMDIQMPVMDGYAAARKIRTLPDFAAIPIIAMTANALVGDRQKALDAGMNDHVTKPINIKEFFKILGQWVNVPQERRGSARLARSRSAASSREATARLPEIPGLDIAEGLQRTVGDAALYEKLLKQFLYNYSEDEGAARLAYKAGDTALASRIAHTVKGLAGSIGAGDLYHSSAALEEALKNGDPGAIKVCFPFYERDLHRLLLGLKAAYPVTSVQLAQPAAAPSVGVAGVLPILRELMAIAAEDDPGAIDFFLEQKKLLVQALAPEVLNNLEKGLRNYEFEDIIDNIKDLIQPVEGRE